MTSSPTRCARLALASLLAVAGCASLRPTRFADAPVIQEVADDVAIRVPEIRLATPISYAEALGTRSFVAALDPRRVPRAGDVNALDEVPRSSWFGEPAGGPLGAVTGSLSGPPVPPLTLLARLPESGRNGVVVIDSRGLRYELGRDTADRAFLRTSAAVVGARLVRELGYRRPEVCIVVLRAADLEPRGVGGQRAPVDVLRAFFDHGPPPRDGVFRVSATRWPIGIDLGPTPAHGMRSDDDNDLVGHEDRRTLRALRLVRAWLSFPGLGVDTARDAYVGPPGEGHVQHFLVGFEGALGADVTRTGEQEPRARDPAPDPTEGRDPLHQLVTLGIGDHRRDTDPRYPALGAFDEKVSDDDHDANLAFAPMSRMQPPDGYWIARRIGLVTDDAIRAAVDAAELPDRATRDRLVQILRARRDAVVARAFSEVTPCDVQGIEKNALVIRDVGYSRRVRGRFVATFVDDDDRPLGPPREVEPNGAVFSLPFPAAPYVVVRLIAIRGSVRAPRAFEAHLRRHGASFHLVGVRH